MRSLKQAAIGSVAWSASLSISAPFGASLAIAPAFESFTSGFLAVCGLDDVSVLSFSVLTEVVDLATASLRLRAVIAGFGLTGSFVSSSFFEVAGLADFGGAVTVFDASGFGASALAFVSEGGSFFSSGLTGFLTVFGIVDGF